MLIPIRAKGTQPNLFVVPGAPGNLGWLIDLTILMGKDYPIFGLEPLGLKQWQNRHQSIHALAKYYISLLYEAQPQGPYHIAGYSFGGTVAYEMVQQLLADGATVSQLMLLDAYAPCSKTIKTLVVPEFFPWLLLGNMFGTLWGIPTLFQANDYSQLDKENYTDYTLERLSKSAKLLVPPTELRRLVENSIGLLVQADELLMSYQPQPLTKKINTYLFQALKGFVSSENELSLPLPLKIEYEDKHGWEQLINHPINLVTISCDHFELVTKPYLTTVATQLKTYLETASMVN